MINHDHRRYFIVEGGPILEKVQAYHNEYQRIRAVWWEQVKALGGLAYSTDAATGRELVAVKFPGIKPPHGWKQADKRTNLCRPRFRSEPAKVLAALPKLPDSAEALKDTDFITSISYTAQGGDVQGTTGIGHPFCYTDIAWYKENGPYMVVLPDQALTCAAKKKDLPDIVFDNDCHLHELNTEGLREILLKEWELEEEKFKRGLL